MLTKDMQHKVENLKKKRDFTSIFTAMAYDERTVFLQNLPSEEATRMLTLLPAERRGKAEKLLSYRRDSVGRLMTPDFIAIQANWTVQETLEHIRA